MKTLIETIARSLVDHPHDVQVTEKQREQTIVYQLSVHPDDTGKVIGKQGKIAKALRTVVNAAGATKGKRIYIDIN
ncbi:UPF0109 protein [Caldalkalibacillus thermarum TA2.A1]|uniref:RNA-binding protein KhpA n=1 Tax=Caldalkalibacillus thermarum (strain TA2.A1) TaxID=986075 RepID=F5L7S2_CALTT|nr:KH domain-containing protein [Caldalkalibacillus thermarum]EGL82581.1 UPF0109 protein [Caldalkalibacillus thermarum TA2.A1]QZT32823.1 KH domain-containing protein [Caldalkalibacillus thermarum TA2.A1]